MTSKHRERMRALAPFAIPEPDSPDLAKLEAALNKRVPRAIAEQFAKRQWKRTHALVSAQLTNGAGLPADSSLREFLGEYNWRHRHYGLNSLPSSFSGLEAFFQHIPPLMCFRLLEERDHQFSWVHFVDHVTASDAKLDLSQAVDAIPERTVLNYSSVDDPGDLLFHGASDTGFGPVAFSLVRHGSEVTVLFTGGQTADLEAETEEAKAAVTSTKPGRAYLQKLDVPLEAVALESRVPLWRTLAAVRFDFAAETENARYVLHDWGDSYLVKTDDVSVFLDDQGRFINEEARRTAENAPQELSAYAALFDLCVTALHLPTYFDEAGALIESRRVETEYRAAIQEASAALLKRWIPARERIAFRNVDCLLPSGPALRVPQRQFDVPGFRVETSGYWKRLEAGKIGVDKKGKPEEGRTWVTKRLSWMEAPAERGPMRSTQVALPEGPDPGWIYVMRTAMHPPNVFKVGLTRRDPGRRAEDLSGTNAPDRFLVVHQWPSADCAASERKIHDLLADARIAENREFFEIALPDLVDTINKVVDSERPAADAL